MEPNMNDHDMGSPSGSPSSEDEKSKTTNNRVTEANRDDLILTKILEGIAKGLEVFSPEIPTWHSEESDQSHTRYLKSHCKSFETYAKLHQWEDPNKALRFRMTLRGGIVDYIDTLPESVNENYKELKKELLSVYHQSSSAAVKFRRWTTLPWQPELTTLKEFAALLHVGFKAITKNQATEKEANLMLKNRLLDAISSTDPAFARYVALNAEKYETYEDFVKFCTSKYPIYNEQVKADNDSSGTEHVGPSDDDSDCPIEDTEIYDEVSQRAENEAAYHDDQSLLANYDEMDERGDEQYPEDEDQCMEAEQYDNDVAAEAETHLCNFGV